MALLRRLEKRILVELPTPEARTEMIRGNIPGKMCAEEFPYETFSDELDVSTFQRYNICGAIGLQRK